MNVPGGFPPQPQNVGPGCRQDRLPFHGYSRAFFLLSGLVGQFSCFPCCLFTLLLLSHICRDAMRRRSRTGQVGGLGWARQGGKSGLHVSAEGAGFLRVDIPVQERGVLPADEASAQPDYVQHNRFLGTTVVSHACGALHRGKLRRTTSAHLLTNANGPSTNRPTMSGAQTGEGTRSGGRGCNKMRKCGEIPYVTAGATSVLSEVY